MKMWVRSAVLMLMPLSVCAAVTRSVVSETDQEARVRLAWSFEEKPESVFVLTESVPAGWAAQLCEESRGSVMQVREEVSGISFLLDPEVCGAEGALEYELVSSVPVARARLSGRVMVSYETQVVSYGIEGAGVCALAAHPMADAEEGAEEPGAESPLGPKKFRITSFEVSPGEEPRVTISWEGAPAGQDIQIEWVSLESLSAAATSRSSKRMRAAGEVEEKPATEWEPFWTVPAERETRMRALGEASEAGTGTVTPDVYAPQGLYRLRVIEK